MLFSRTSDFSIPTISVTRSVNGGESEVGTALSCRMARASRMPRGDGGLGHVRPREIPKLTADRKKMLLRLPLR